MDDPREHRVQAPRRRTAGNSRKAPASPPSGPLSRRRLYLAAFGAAGAIAVALIAVSLVGGQSSGGGATTSGAVVGTAATTQLLAGIPQHGTTLGSPSAPLKLVEYADFQCPYCGDFARDVLPTLVRDYVRPGNLQIEYRGLAFVGSDSTVALRTALAAAAQNRFWNVADLLFRNQGTENAGWVTDSLVRGILGAVPGLDASRVLGERDGAAVTTGMNAAERLAASEGVNATPTFELGPRSGSLQTLQPSSLDPSSFTSALDAFLGG